MPRKLTFQGKAVLLTVLIIAVWWVAPVAIKKFTRISFFEFQAPSWVGLSYLKDVQDYWVNRSHSKSELIQAGIEMAELNAAYELRNQQAAFQESEVQRLEALLDMPSLPEHRYEVARVIRRDLNAWWQQIIVRKGTRHGVAQGQAVVFSGGVVGKVKEAHLYTAVVELLTSPGFRVAAHFEGDLRPIQFTGGYNPLFSTPHGVASNVPSDVHIPLREERRIVSSRLGGVFPDGLSLGRIKSLNLEPDGLFQNGKVAIDPRLLSLREVAILIPLGEDELAWEEPGR